MAIVLYVIFVLILLFILLVFIAPKQYKVNRSITIDKNHHEVFEYLKHIRNQDSWSPWKQKDPDMKQEFVGTDGEVGFIAKWDGNKDVGSGEQEIVKIVKNKSITTKLRFFKPWKSESDGVIKVAALGNSQTKVTWGFYGKNKVPANVFMMLYNVDKHVGKDFEEGLASLKEILESK